MPAQWSSADVTALRRDTRRRAAQRPRGPELHAVEDLDAGGVGARLYRHADERPLLVFCHGGMWIIGDLDTHDRLCRQIATGAGVDVLAIDYRRAPEHPWPAAVDDAVAAVRFASVGRAVAIGGDSAGGCIAALAALILRDTGGPAACAQILLCPNTDLTATPPSVPDGGLDPGAVRAAAELWAPDAASASPLHAPDLRGLPPAVVITAERDPLRDEGDAYARRLADAGVPVTHRCEPGLPHGFVQNMDLVSDAAAAATARAIADIRRIVRV